MPYLQMEIMSAEGPPFTQAEAEVKNEMKHVIKLRNARHNKQH